MQQKLLSEFLGTFILVFIGTGSVVVNSLTGSLGLVGISISFGLVVIVLIYTFGHISGAHFNPAVTIALSIANKFDKKDVPKYVLVQILGAIFASFVLLVLFQEEAKSAKELAYYGATLPRGSWYQSFILEFILTFILMLVIYGTAVNAKAHHNLAGLSIGFAVLFGVFIGGPISGGSINPARSIGPAFISGNYEYLWIYLVATILGAISAVLVFEKLEL